MSFSPDRMSDLEVFSAIMDAGSFSAAGRRLELASSSVGRIVDRIEARLGVRLLLRTTRSLTRPREAPISPRSSILTDLKEENSLSRISCPARRPERDVLLTVDYFWFPFGEFRRRYPDSLLDINLTDTVIDIAAGQVDVGIRFGPMSDSSLIARKLGETRKVIVASPDYLARRGTPQVPEDLHSHDCLGFNFKRAAPTWPFRKDGRDYSLRSAEASRRTTARHGSLAEQGVGITRVGATTCLTRPGGRACAASGSSSRATSRRSARCSWRGTHACSGSLLRGLPRRELAGHRPYGSPIGILLSNDIRSGDQAVKVPIFL